MGKIPIAVFPYRLVMYAWVGIPIAMPSFLKWDLACLIWKSKEGFMTGVWSFLLDEYC